LKEPSVYFSQFLGLLNIVSRYQVTLVFGFLKKVVELFEVVPDIVLVLC